MGHVELATATETTTGTDNSKAVHPAGLKAELDKKFNKTGGTLTGDATIQKGVPTLILHALRTNKSKISWNAGVSDNYGLIFNVDGNNVLTLFSDGRITDSSGNDMRGGIKSVQRGTVNASSGGTTITITSVDTTKAFVIVNTAGSSNAYV